MFGSVLVANRAEIAVRIFRTARTMGIRTIAVFSDADAKAKHVREADEAIHIGAAPAGESYLRGEKIIAAALKTGAEAIHPGYGFLSENPDFAEAVVKAGLIWIGPTPAAIRAMGLKDEAKRIAEEAGVPVVPGYRGEAQDAKTLVKAAKDVGFPVLIKAVAGGGGRGIREVTKESEFAAALESAKREAAAAFGDDRVIVEKLIARPRHIEVQVFGDKHGNLVHLFERDCSLQRRRQKVIEEAPAPGMTEEVRAAMTDAALKVARAVKYENAGTVEYVVDGSGPLRPDGFWFLEMNTRLQVEHPVTEAITGLDLVEWQFRVAAGEKLPKTQEEITLTGHAIEARIVAEDVSDNFRPSVGRLAICRWPNYARPHLGESVTDWSYALRVDAGFDEGDVVPSAYDSLLCKVIARSRGEEAGANRSNAAAVLDVALCGTQVWGLTTNAGFLARCLRNRDFHDGAVHTGLIAEHIEALADNSEDRRVAAAWTASRRLRTQVSNDPWAVADGWRASGSVRNAWRFEQGDAEIEITLTPAVEGWTAHVEGCDMHVPPRVPRRRDAVAVHETSEGALAFFGGEAFEFLHPGASREHADGVGGDAIKAPLPGKIVAISAAQGATVKKGDSLVTLEAMKMEHALKAPRDGIIAEIAVAAGAQVKEGALLVRLEEEAA